MSIFTGAGVALVTPFKEDLSVDYDQLEKFIDFQIDNGTDSIVICGTSGEASTMSHDEQIEVVSACVSHVNGRVPVIAGAGANCTDEALNLAKRSEKAGADGLLVVTPYYNKATQKGLEEYYTTVGNSVDIPIIMYNVPSRTGCNILPETAATLFKNETNIVGLKEATGSLAQASKTMDLTDGKLDLYSGEDGLVVPLMSIGAIGVISVWSNVAPKDVHDMCMSYLNGDTKKALEIQMKGLPLVDALFSEVNPIPVKKALNLMGMEVGPLRLPLTEMEVPEANGEMTKRPMLGVKSVNVIELDHEKLSLPQSLKEAFLEAWNVTEATLRGVGQMVTGKRSGEEIGGIIRIAEMSGDISKQNGILDLVVFMALLSINLGLINLFPIPVLDGGHIVIYLAEIAVGKEINTQIKDALFKGGFSLIIALMIFATWNDFVRLFHRWFA